MNADRKTWNNYLDGFKKVMAPLWEEVNDYFVTNAGTALPELFLHPISPHLNIYLYPEELDYKELHPLPKNWVRVENFVRVEPNRFEVPDKLKNKPGKLIFFSMGSFGCGNVQLMTRLVKILAKSEHRFIVSKGPVFDSYELPDNMWGQRLDELNNALKKSKPNDSKREIMLG